MISQHWVLAQEGAQRFTLRHKAWVYEIPDWKAKYLTKPQSDLLEDKEEKPAEVPVDTPPPAETLTPAVLPSQPVVPPPAGPNRPAEVLQAAEPNEPVQ